MKRFIGYYRPCDFMTMTGTAFGFTGIMLSAAGHFVLAGVCLLMSGLCDGLDGTLARKHNYDQNARNYGVQLDSLSDTVCFGVAPAFLTACIAHNIVSYVFCGLYILCGVIRLAYFNMLAADPNAEKGVYIGLPITAVSIVYPPVLFILSAAGSESMGIILTSLLVVLALLFISRFKIKKPNIFGALIPSKKN